MEIAIGIKITCGGPQIFDILFELGLQYILCGISTTGVSSTINRHGISIIVSQIKRDFILVTAEFDIYNSRTVGRNFFGLALFIGKVLAISRTRGKRLATRNRRARQRSLFLRGKISFEFIIVCVFAPVGNNILHLSRIPNRSQDHAAFRSDRATDGVTSLIHPAAKSIADLGGLSNGIQVNTFTLRDLNRVNARAAGGIEGKPINRGNDGGNISICFYIHTIKRSIGTPDHPTIKFSVLGVIRIGFSKADRIVVIIRGFFGYIDIIVIIRIRNHEVHVKHIAELRRDFNCGRLGIGRQILHAGNELCAIRQEPTFKLFAGFNDRSCRLINRLGRIIIGRFFHCLCADRRTIHSEIEGDIHILIRLHDALQRNAGAGLRAAGDGHDGRQRVHGRAADEHENGHQQGKTPTKLVFHKKLILPMKFR